MSYTVEASKYNGETSGNFVLEVNVMLTQGADSTYWDTQYDYIVNALDQAYNTYVPATIARKYDTDADLDCNNLLSSGNTWLDNNLDYDGLYLWVVPCDGSPFACCHESGWDGRHQAFIKTLTYPTVHETAVTGIMEALHPYLYNKSCPYVQDEAGGDEDHNLGNVVSDRFDSNHWASPMLGHYGKSRATAGMCDNWNDDHGFQKTLTSCTLESLEYSWNHAAGNHNH